VIIHRAKPGPPPVPGPKVKTFDTVCGTLYAAMVVITALAIILLDAWMWNEASKPGAGLGGVGVIAIVFASVPIVMLGLASIFWLTPRMWRADRSAFWQGGLLLLLPMGQVAPVLPLYVTTYPWILILFAPYLCLSVAMLWRGTR